MTCIPATVALFMILATTYTTVTAGILIAASVLCFVLSFLSLVFAYTIREGGKDICNSPDAIHEAEMEEFCGKEMYFITMQAVQCFLWLVVGILVLSIPQPGSYTTGQITTFDGAPDSLDEADFDHDREQYRTTELT